MHVIFVMPSMQFLPTLRAELLICTGGPLLPTTTLPLFTALLPPTTRLPPSAWLSHPETQLSCHRPAPIDHPRLCPLLTDDQLYPVVHDHLSLLRYPSSLMVAKVAMVEAVMSLHPPWAEAWHRRSPLNLVRIIMAGWGSLYRLAFLLATGQADTMTPIWALQATHAMFGRHYPDYAGWLDG